MDKKVDHFDKLSFLLRITKKIRVTLSLAQLSFSLFMYISQMISFLFLMINTALSATFPQGSKEIFQALLSQQLHLVHSVLAVLSVHHYLEESTVKDMEQPKQDYRLILSPGRASLKKSFAL